MSTVDDDAGGATGTDEEEGHWEDCGASTRRGAVALEEGRHGPATVDDAG